MAGGFLKTGSLPTVHLIGVGAPQVAGLEQEVVGAGHGGEAAVGAVEVPGALPHVGEDGRPLAGLVVTLLSKQLVVVDAGTAVWV